MNTATRVFDERAREYDDWFDLNPGIFAAQVESLHAVFPSAGQGLEIGVGTGRFASRLGIQNGLDLSLPMLTIARKRGVDCVQGAAEDLPYRSGMFDRVLMMTVICFMDDFPRSFREIYRVLAPGGTFVVGFLEKNGEIARSEEARKPSGRFLRYATFRTGEEVARALEETGFLLTIKKDNRGFCVMKAKKE